MMVPLRCPGLLLFAALGASSTLAAPNRVKADNSKMNQRDAEYRTLTPEDQASGTDRDVEITRLIRRKITSRDDLSTYAKNIKIITLNGIVTLRGPVQSAEERRIVEALAREIVGNGDPARINNQLEPSMKQQAR